MEFGNPPTLYLYGVVFASFAMGFVDSETCLLDQVTTPEGKCVDCRFCPAGQGMDMKEEVMKNEAGDPIGCRTCKPCGRGYYNDPKNDQYYCMKCPAPCIEMNRKEYLPCGGSSKGQCGACINSDYEDKDLNLDSPCRTRVTEKTTEPPVIYQPSVSNAHVVVDEPGKTKDNLPNTSSGLSVEWICLIITFVGVAVVLAILILKCTLFKNHTGSCRNDPELGKQVSSKTTIISTNANSVVDYSNNTDLSNDTNLEIDAPMLQGHMHSDDQPHPELSCSAAFPSSGPECLHGVSKDYPTFLLTANDRYIIYTSKHIFNEDKINPMFREMGLTDQLIYAEHQLYVLQKQTYEDMNIHYLQDWIKKAGRHATFDVLCQHLDKHGFSNVTDKLMEIYQEHR